MYDGLLIQLSNKCTTCGEFVWFDPPTPLSQIDPHVVDRIARRQEIISTSGSIPCSSPHCMTASGARRDANKLCECNDPGPLCRPCCLIRGGCRQHRPLPGSIREIGSQKNNSKEIFTVMSPTQATPVTTPALHGVSLSLQQVLSQVIVAQGSQIGMASQVEGKLLCIIIVTVILILPKAKTTTQNRSSASDSQWSAPFTA